LVRIDFRRVRLEQFAMARPDVRAEFGLDGACGFARGPHMSTPTTECLPDALLAATGEDNVFVMVRKVEGGWQLDPMATLIAWAETLVTNGTGSDLGALLDLM